MKKIKCTYRNSISPYYCTLSKGEYRENINYFCPIRENNCCILCVYQLRCPDICRKAEKEI